MDIINSVLSFLVNLMNSILPVLNLPTEFYQNIDTAMSILIEIINGAGYFIPLGSLAACFGIVYLVDHWSLVFRLALWLVKLIRG